MLNRLNLYTDASKTNGFGAYFSGPGSGNSGCLIRSCPSIPFSGMNCLPLWQQLMCVGPQASRTSHQVPGCGSCVVWSVLPGSEDHVPSSGVVLCGSMQQFYNPTCANTTHWQMHCLGTSFHGFCSCPTGRTGSQIHTHSASQSLDMDLASLIHRALAGSTTSTY